MKYRHFCNGGKVTEPPIKRMLLESQLQLLRQSRNLVYRNLGQTAYREGLQAARDLYQRGRKLHFSESEALASRNSRYLDGIGMMVSYGITGSMVAAFASPVLVRGLVDGLGARVVQRMGSETLIQVATSFILHGNSSRVDYADIGMSGLLGRWSLISNSLVDVNQNRGLATSFGLGREKSILETSLDLGVGIFNLSFNHLVNNSEINKKVANYLNVTNGNIRILVTETAKND